MSSKTSQWLMRFLEEPTTRGLDLDDPETSVRRRQLSKTKRALHLSYVRWYRMFAEIDRAAPPGLRVELGSGGGFLEEFIPGLITTDVLPLPFVKMVCPAEKMPFEDASVGAIYMINVLHHVCDPGRFFAEAARVLVPGGVVAMTEPYVSAFSRLIYAYVHHEPFDPTAASWQLPPSGPLSGGNDALPWNIFVRDRELFLQRHPELALESVEPHTFISHLLSGGVTMRSFVPAAVIPMLQGLERMMKPAMKHLGVFGTIVVRKGAGTTAP